MKRYLLTLIFCVCALVSGAQTLTSTYVALADSADRYIKAERWDDAERVIIKALRHEPANKSNYLLWSNLGTVRMSQENYDGALEAFGAGLASAPRSTTLLANRARALLAKGDAEGAMADLDLALDTDSTLQWPRKMRGLLRAAMGDSTGAENDFKVYGEHFGPDADVSEARGDIAAAKCEGEQATDLYLEAYELQPDAGLLAKAAMNAYMFGHIERMDAALNEGIRRFPDAGVLFLMHAMVHQAMYQPDAMESDLKRTHELGVDEELYQRLVRQRR